MDWYELWARFSSNRRLAKSTLVTYRAGLDRFRQHWPELTEPSQVQERHLLEWRLHESQKGLAEATTTGFLRCIISMLRWAHRQDLLLLDPACDLEIRKPTNKIPRILTQDEILRLLDAPLRTKRRFIAGRDRAILELLYGSGMRGGELVALDLRDLDVADCSVLVRGGKGRPRKVCFAPSVTVILERYLKDYRPARAQAGESALFVNLRGTRLSRNMLGHQLALYGRKLGIPDITPHALRRAFATHLLENGANIVEIKNLLGHVDIDSTMVYARLFPVELMRAHRKSHPRARRKEQPDDH